MAEQETRLKTAVAAGRGDERLALQDQLLNHQQMIKLKREELGVFLRSLGNPPTRLYRGQLPLFPVIYHLAVDFDPATSLTPVIWDSELPREASQYRVLR